MSNNTENQLREIEATQAELRRSIDTSRELAEQAQHLLDKHRRDLDPKH